MFSLYLVTGASGYLGATLIEKLRKLGARVRALVLPGDRLKNTIPEGIEEVEGDVADRSSLEPFFRDAGAGTCLIHAAGMISIASRKNPKLEEVNFKGTKNITDLALEKGIGRMIYVSSVHAIPVRPKGETMSETMAFSPDLVVGQYAKSKAEATEYVVEAAAKGLNVSVVHPSGIIGPNDRAIGNITGTILSYCRGKLRAGVKGGYDFVDVRDVADGIISCTERGKPGECYILSNRYASVKEILETVRKITRGKKILFYLPLKLVSLIAPICERISLRKKQPLFLTPYSVYTMGSNAAFSHAKATRELGYRPRKLSETLRDMVSWLKDSGMLSLRRGKLR